VSEGKIHSTRYGKCSYPPQILFVTHDIYKATLHTAFMSSNYRKD